MCVPNYSIYELLVRETHKGKLIRYFRLAKILDILHNQFYWPKMKRDVQKICDRCIKYRQTKFKVLSHGLYTSLLVPKKP